MFKTQRPATISDTRNNVKEMLPKENITFFYPMVDVKLSNTWPITKVTNLKSLTSKLAAVTEVETEVETGDTQAAEMAVTNIRLPKRNFS